MARRSNRSEEEVEPIYGKTYLPRKFKITIAVPPSNDVDIFANCLSFIAIVEDGKLVGFNVAVGGGMGSTHGNEATYPRLADVIGFCTAGAGRGRRGKGRARAARLRRPHRPQALALQIHRGRPRPGVDPRQAQRIPRLRTRPRAPVSSSRTTATASAGWRTRTATRTSRSSSQGGRVLDTPAYPLLTGLREIAKIHDGDFRLTANQNLIIANVSPAKRPEIEKLLEQYGIKDSHLKSALRLNSLACVALPTCGLALAEAERYLPDLLTELEEVIEENGLRHDAITIRMTGCPNGCARPFIAEIGFVGRAPGRYNVYLGGGFAGQRLSKLYRESVPAEDIKPLLAPDHRPLRQGAERRRTLRRFLHPRRLRGRHRPGRGFPPEHQAGSARSRPDA